MNRYKFDEAKHIHSLDGKPLIGTTTSLDVISKPLTFWASGMACSELGWVNPKKEPLDICVGTAGKFLQNIRGMSDQEYCDLLNRAYKAHATYRDKRADSGKDMHGLIEEQIKCHIKQGCWGLLPDSSILPFIQWADDNVKEFMFSEIHCYSERLWVGGIADFAYIDKAGKRFLGDIKSSDKMYFTHPLQLAAYDMQLSENGGFDKNGNKVFSLEKPFDYYAVFPMTEFIEPTITQEIKLYQTGYEACLTLYKVRQQSGFGNKKW